MELEIKRQVVHASGILVILLIQIFGRWIGALLMLSSCLILLFLGEYRKNKEKMKIVSSKALDEFEDYLENELKTYERSAELPFKGAITLIGGCFLATLLFEPFIAIASIAVLALADASSTLVGSFLGKHKLSINRKKSWEGSLTFFITAFLILMLFVDPIKAFTISIFTTFIEMLPKIDDNLTIPLTIGILMTIFS